MRSSNTTALTAKNSTKAIAAMFIFMALIFFNFNSTAYADNCTGCEEVSAVTGSSDHVKYQKMQKAGVNVIFITRAEYNARQKTLKAGVQDQAVAVAVTPAVKTGKTYTGRTPAMFDGNLGIELIDGTAVTVDTTDDYFIWYKSKVRIAFPKTYSEKVYLQNQGWATTSDPSKPGKWVIWEKKVPGTTYAAGKTVWADQTYFDNKSDGWINRIAVISAKTGKQIDCFDFKVIDWKER